MKKISILFVMLCLCVLMLPVYASAEEELELPWHEGNPYIRHAGGNIQNVSAENTVKAFQNSIDKGYTVIEMDFSFTTDGKLVCIHDWKQGKMTYKEFKKSKVRGIYKRATAAAVIDMLIDNPDVYLVVDAKEEDMLKVYRALSWTCEMAGDWYTMDRIIPQIYKQEELEQLKQIYDFKNYIFTLYRLKCDTLSDYQNIAQYCAENQIDVVTIPKQRLNKSIVKVFRKKGIKVYTHTVNSSAQRKKYLKMKVSGFYSDKF